VSADIGVDGAIEFINEKREPSGDLVLVQAKSGSSYISRNSYYLQADRDHFETWARYSIPVVGIVHNPKKTDARWVDISEHLRKHPEQITSGPYRILAPEEQPFTLEGIAAFVGKFRGKPTTGTVVATPPNLSIRAWRPEDAVPTRALLSSISSDYPDFYDWLERQWQQADVSKKVVEVGQAIAAYSMWKRKDTRNVKLQTFIVGSLFQGSAVGQHLLYHELRHWAQEKDIERVYVTVSSSKADLTEYFYRFGFRVEGIAANRYMREPNDAELVLVKHFVRDVITTPEELDALKHVLCRRLWGIDDSNPCSEIFGVREDNLFTPLHIPQIVVILNKDEHSVESRIALKDEAGELLRNYDDYSLMRDFYPLRLYLRDKKYIVVPIQPIYSNELFARETDASELTQIKLRVDHVYYCTPRHTDLSCGDLVLFYETKRNGRAGEAFGTAVVRDCKIDAPEALWKEYRKRGVFKLRDIRQHSRDGKAMAIHFDFFEPFSRAVPLDRIRTILKRNAVFQSLTALSRHEFQNIISEGSM
jgi:ribosomal protein S18 acetylase RimI-like enzyme/predicted transcriptional regulator